MSDKQFDIFTLKQLSDLRNEIRLDFYKIKTIDRKNVTTELNKFFYATNIKNILISLPNREAKFEKLLSLIIQINSSSKLLKKTNSTLHVPPKDDFKTMKSSKHDQIQKTPVKIAQINIDYNEDNIISNVNIGLSSQSPNKSSSSENNDEITPKIISHYLSDPKFITAISKNLKELYEYKHDKYLAIFKDLEKQILKDEKSQKILIGVSEQDRQKAFPMLKTNKLLFVKIKEIYTEISEKLAKWYTNQQLMTSLIEALETIASLTGKSRENIRNFLSTQIFVLSRSSRPFTSFFLNISLIGSAGVGKSKAADIISKVYSKMHILVTGDIFVTSPKDYVSGWIGNTADQTAGVLRKGLENIIFIDEAYQLVACKDGKIERAGHGEEAITEIVNYLDKYIGLSIMIVAGYQKEIDGCFFGSNEGLRRRFPITLELKKYTTSDLLSIFINEVNKNLGKEIFEETHNRYIFTIMSNLNKNNKIFSAQAGDIMNLVSIFLSSYYSNIKYEWGTINGNISIINATFNRFVRSKGYKLNITTT